MRRIPDLDVYRMPAVARQPYHVEWRGDQLSLSATQSLEASKHYVLSACNPVGMGACFVAAARAELYPNSTEVN